VTRRISLTLRLTLLFAAASTMVLLILGYIIGAAVEQHFVEQDLALLNGKLELTQHALEKMRSKADLDGLPQQMDDALIGHHGLLLVVQGADGHILFATRDAPFPQALLDSRSDATHPLLWRARDGMSFRGIVAAVPTGIKDWPRARIAVATDISHHLHFMASFRRTLWWMVIGAALATGLLGAVAAKKGLAPLAEMTREAATVSAQHLHRRLAVDAAPLELAALAESLNAMLARLEESFRRLSDFSSDIAHELRTPVSNLLMQTQVALSRPRSVEAYRETLESNTEEFERLSRMISDMLFLARAEHGLMVPALEAFDLAKEVTALFDFYAALAEEKEVKLRLRGSARVEGDRLMLRRAISNLLSNALRHTPRGGSIEVTIALGRESGDEDREQGGVRVAVENRGEPIAAEHLPRLFDRFYRVDASRRSVGDGVGLGLAITRSIMKAHGGEIAVRTVDQGNRFELRLPPLEASSSKPS
jgi:two-component system heavy metal sensor histidine kinase CusS